MLNNGVKSDDLASYLCEYLFKRLYNKESRFKEVLKTMILYHLDNDDLDDLLDKSTDVEMDLDNLLDKSSSSDE